MKTMIAVLLGSFALSAFAQYDTGYTRMMEQQMLKKFQESQAANKGVMLVSYSGYTGAKCSNGGVKIKSGLDKNQNAILGNEEVTEIRYVCNK